MSSKRDRETASATVCALAMATRLVRVAETLRLRRRQAIVAESGSSLLSLSSRLVSTRIDSVFLSSSFARLSLAVSGEAPANKSNHRVDVEQYRDQFPTLSYAAPDTLVPGVGSRGRHVSVQYVCPKISLPTSQSSRRTETIFPQWVEVKNQVFLSCNMMR